MTWLCAVASLLVAPGLAKADARYVVRWEAPPGCADAARVDEALRTWVAPRAPTLRPSAKGAEEAKVEATAEVRPHPAGWELSLTLDTGVDVSHESFVAASCAPLVDLVALKVALAVNPVGAATRARDVRTATHGDPSWTAHAWVLGARASVGAEAGVLPEIGVTAALALMANRGPFRAEVGGIFGFASRARYLEHPSVGADVEQLAGTARLCVVPSLGALRFPLCALGELGALPAAGFGVARAQHTAPLWLALGVGPSAELPLGARLALAAGVDALAPTTRPIFFMANLQTLHRPDALAARGWLGIAWRL